MKTLAALAGTVFMGLIHLGTAEATEISTTYDTSVYTSPNSTVTFDNSGYAGSAGDGEVARDYLMFVMPSGPKTSSRFGDASQCFWSFTSWWPRPW